MEPKDFLRGVCARAGYYCISWRWLPEGAPKKVWANKLFSTQQEALAFSHRKANETDIYFACFTMRKLEMWDPKLQKNRKRTQANALATRCFYLDIDVGDEPEKYHSQDEALIALDEFVAVTQLPAPIVVTSGYGLHVYWALTEDFAAAHWQPHAENLAALARHHKLKVDTSVTTDCARVLRIPGTKNHKDPKNLQDVAVLRPGDFSAVADMVQLISDAVVRGGVDTTTKLKPAPANSNLFGISNLVDTYEGPKVQLKDLGEVCAQVRHAVGMRGNVREPMWRHVILNTVAYAEQGTMSGRDLAHALSSGHPDYDPADTELQLDRLAETPGKPSKCETIEKHSCKPELCQSCRFRNDPFVANPLVAALRSAKAEAPQVQQVFADQTVTTNIPDPPAPFTRLKSGGIGATIKNADDEDRTEIIYPYDIYPVRRVTNALTSTEQQVWRAALPFEKEKEFTLDADALYDQRKFVVSIANHGIYPHRSQLSRLQEYMTAYINELQRTVAADIQSTHLGWTEDYQAFVFPDKIVDRKGVVKAVSLSLGAQRSSAHVTKKGTLEAQIEALKFYNDPRYVQHVDLVLACLGAPIFHMTGHHGVVVNASGPAGSSKSTALYTGASLFGDPMLYTINGTESGATARARDERVSVMSNYPICVDEITHIERKAGQNLVMGITQPGHRLRLSQRGVEQPSSSMVKSTILVSTSNSTLHGLLSSENVAGTAGSMRVVEIPFEPMRVHEKYEADDHMRTICNNYGHVGEVFLLHVLQHYEEIEGRVRARVRELDRLLGIEPSERFQSACFAVKQVAGEIAKELGLLDYDGELHTRWIVERQMPYTRGVIIEEYSDPLSILADYMNLAASRTIVTQKASITPLGSHNLAQELKQPTGPELIAHYDTSLGIMYIQKSAFRAHCAKLGADPTKILTELSHPRPHESIEAGTSNRIILERGVKRTLGAGTIWAKGQTRCFSVNMRHPDIEGKAEIKLVSGGDVANDEAA